MANMNGILHEISQERHRLENQLGALRAAELEIKKLVDSRNGRPVKASLRVHDNRGGPRTMSAAARARIAAAQRARWAAWHKSQGR